MLRKTPYSIFTSSEARERKMLKDLDAETCAGNDYCVVEGDTWSMKSAGVSTGQSNAKDLIAKM